MAAAKNFFQALGRMAVANEQMELKHVNLMWKWIITQATHRV